MLKKNYNLKLLFQNLLLLCFLRFIESQTENTNDGTFTSIESDLEGIDKDSQTDIIFNEYCDYDFLEVYDLYYDEKNEISLDSLNDIVAKNLGIFSSISVLAYFGNDYQLFLFNNSLCTLNFLNVIEIESLYYHLNNLHLFSISNFHVNQKNILKLVVQTKKEFYILLYAIDENGNINLYSDLDKINYTIKTNIFPYYTYNLITEEYSIFEKESINIFDKNEKIFNDICYLFKSRDEAKSPELRKKLFYFKYGNRTYPLLESMDNCVIVNNNISYKNKSFILEYNCSNTLAIEKNRIKIYTGIEQQIKEEREKYDGPNSLKDQEELLYCNKEVYKNDKIKKNVGFYISLFLLFGVFVFWIILIIQNYDIVKKTAGDSPPKKKKIQEEEETKQKKKVNFATVEILSDGKKKRKKKKLIDDDNENNIEDNNIIPKKPKKKKKKKKIKNNTMIDDNENEKNDDYNNDLEWYSNNLDDDENNKDDNDDNNNINNSNNSSNDIKIKIKKKKKKGKKKKKKRSLSNKKIEKEEEKAKSDEEKQIYVDNNINTPKKMNKTMTNFNKNIYNQFKEDSANTIRSALKLRRLVIITNLGKNLEETNYNINNTNKLFGQPRLQENSKINKSNDSNANTNEPIAIDKLTKKNSLFPMIKDNLVDQEQNERNHILSKIIGFEDNSFLSNIKRDYLEYNDAIFYDNREYCSLLSHYLKLKVDLINIFCCSYSFSPYSIRIIKFLFFFHFMFYLETLCIGQKYYFKKHFSKEYQEIIEDTIKINVSDDNHYYFLEKYFSLETIKLIRVHYLYTFKYAFPRVLIPMAISFISYFVTTFLTPRRKIMKIFLDPNISKEEKFRKYHKISAKYKIIYIIFATLGMLLMAFFFYSITNYFVIFDDAKYDIPQSFILSGLSRFILDIIIWIIIANVRKLSVESHNDDFYGFVRGIYELN